MKTIKEWIDTLPQDIREKAYKYESPTWTAAKGSLDRAVKDSFAWWETDEGHDYWQDVYTRALDGEFDQPEWTHERLVELVKFVSGASRNWVNAEETTTTEDAEEILKDFQA